MSMHIIIIKYNGMDGFILKHYVYNTNAALQLIISDSIIMYTSHVRDEVGLLLKLV